MNKIYNSDDIVVISQQALQNIAVSVSITQRESGLNIKDFAKKHDMGKDYIGMWVNGTYRPNPQLRLLYKMYTKNIINLPLCIDWEVNLSQDPSPLLQIGNSKDYISLRELILRSGAEIEYHMEKNGYVTRSFHKHLGIASGTITKYINAKNREGSNGINLITLLKFVYGLEIDFAYILSKDYELIGHSSVDEKVDSEVNTENTINLNPEKVFNMILSSKPEIIKEIYPNGFRPINCEKQLKLNNGDRRRVDIYGVDEIQNVPVFIEVQLNAMDKIHFRQVKGIIRSISEGVIILIALKIDCKDFNEVNDLINSSGKKIKLLFVEYNSNFLDSLTQLAYMSDMESHEESSQPDFVNPILTVKKELSTMDDNFIGSLEEHSSYNNVLMDKLIPKMRENLWAYGSIRSLQIKEDSNSLVLSAGLREIELKVYLPSDGSSESYIQILSPNKKRALSDFGIIKLKLLDTNFGASIFEVGERKLLMNYGVNNFIESTPDIIIVSFTDLILRDVGTILQEFSMYSQSLKRQPSN